MISNSRNPEHFTIGGLLFDDDLVLIAQYRKDMEKLLKIVLEFEEEMSLQFNPEKSAIAEFAKCADADRAFEVQNRTLPVQNSVLHC